MSNLYSISFSDLEKAQKASKGKKFDAKDITFHRIEYGGNTLLVPPELSGKEKHTTKSTTQETIIPLRLFVPIMANFLANKYEDYKERFSSLYSTDVKYKSTFLILGGRMDIRTYLSFKSIISFFSVNIFKKAEDLDKGKLTFIYSLIEDKADFKNLLGNAGKQPQSIDDAAQENEEIISTTHSPSKFARNRIIFGAPGTGKSWKLKEESAIFGDHVTRVTFHPEYSYYDFVGSYKPVMRQNEQGERKIEYSFVPGPFTRILAKALTEAKEKKEEAQPYLLIIEEINRARAAAVFGDIFQLLDREKGGESEYTICLSEDLKDHLKQKGHELEELKLTPNIYIWATMNSADQGVYPLDTAFKRRWSMEYLDIDSGKKDDDWNQIRTGINKLLIEKGHVNEDKLMGYYFLKAEERTDAHLEDSLKGKVLMYLFEDAAKPCRKDIFKEINKARIYSDLRAKLSLSEPNLGIFDGAVFWTGKNTTTGSDQDSAAPKAEEAEPVDNQQ